jgi:hypothetical protein
MKIKKYILPLLWGILDGFMEFFLVICGILGILILYEKFEFDVAWAVVMVSGATVILLR